MAGKEPTLEQRLSMLLVTLEEAQGTNLTLLEGIAQERNALKAEWERFAALRQELPKVAEESAQTSAQTVLERVSLRAADMLRLHHQPIVDRLTAATLDAQRNEDSINRTIRELQGGWKMPALKLLGIWGVGLVVFGLVCWLVWSGFDFDERRQEQEHTHLVEKNALLQQQYDTMKAEMKTWKESKEGQLKLEPCPAPLDYLKCVRVDKTRGALGKGKDLFVPASEN